MLFFFSRHPVLVCSCLYFLSSRIFLVYFSGYTVPKGMYFGWICFPTVTTLTLNTTIIKNIISIPYCRSPSISSSSIPSTTPITPPFLGFFWGGGVEKLILVGVQQKLKQYEAWTSTEVLAVKFCFFHFCTRNESNINQWNSTINLFLTYNWFKFIWIHWVGKKLHHKILGCHFLGEKNVFDKLQVSLVLTIFMLYWKGLGAGVINFLFNFSCCVFPIILLFVSFFLLYIGNDWLLHNIRDRCMFCVILFYGVMLLWYNHSHGYLIL